MHTDIFCSPQVIFITSVKSRTQQYIWNYPEKDRWPQWQPSLQSCLWAGCCSTAAERALGCSSWLLKAPQLWEEIPLLLAGWMTGQQGSKHEISEWDCIPLNPLQTTQWCQVGASLLLVMAGITEVKWTQSRGLVQLGMCCLKPLLSVQLSLKLMYEPCAYWECTLH